MSLLIDADYFVYKSCASAEDEIDWGDDTITVVSSFHEVKRLITREIDTLKLKFKGEVEDLILFFSSPNNFRKTIRSDYKGHRNRKKPCGYTRAINWLREEYQVETIDHLEADDVLGIYSTNEPGKHIICSPDKDMKQIPGLLYALNDEVQEISKEEGDQWHLVQTLSGDQTDGYAGVPGIGIKKAEALFNTDGWTWDTVVKAYTTKGLTEKDALENARLARILRSEDFDKSTNTPILWTPNK